MNLLRRSRTCRILLRVSFAFTASEATLALSALLIERHAAACGASSGEGAIVCVGDSNTFGVGAPPGSSYPDQLRDRLHSLGDSHPVVNLGLPGISTRAMVDRLESLLEGGSPACVVFLGGANDRMRPDQLIGLESRPATWRDHVRGLLSNLRTYRVLRTALHVVRGDVAHREFDGQESTRPTFAPFR